MRIRFFNTYEPVVPFYQELLPYLAARGHQVKALVARQAYRNDGRAANEWMSRLHTLSAQRATHPFARASTHASYAFVASCVSALSKQVDVNVFLTQPPLFNSWGLFLKLARRQPYVCHVMDLYPWVGFAAGVIQESSRLGSTLEHLAVEALKGAKHVVAIGRCMVERLAALGVARDRIRFIPNWANIEVVRPIAARSNPLRQKLGLQDKFVVMYSGNMGVSHAFDDLVEVARRLKALDDVVFVLVGKGVRSGELRRSTQGLQNVRFLDFQPQELLSQSLSMGDVHFVSLRSEFEGLLVPSKAYGILAAGRPIVYQGSRSGEIGLMVNEEGAGTVVAHGDADGLEAAILKGRTDADWLTETGRRARDAAERKYCSEIFIRDYEQMLLS